MEDMLARYGGEEFAVVLPETDIGVAVEVADRLRLAVEAREQVCRGQQISVTISVGVAALREADDEQGLQILARADGALYGAKEGGRNLVKIEEL